MPRNKIPSVAQVRSARKMAADGADVESIAKTLDLGVVSVSSLIYGRTFAHITDPPPLPGSPIPANTNGIDTRINHVLLRTIRVNKLMLSQEQFAQAIQRECVKMGRNTSCTKRLVQRWESGDHALPSIQYREPIEHVTGVSFTSLCELTPPPDAQQIARDLEPLIKQTANLHVELLKIQRCLLIEPAPIKLHTEASD